MGGIRSADHSAAHKSEKRLISWDSAPRTPGIQRAQSPRGRLLKPSLLERGGGGPSRSDGRVSGYTLGRRAGTESPTAPRSSSGSAYPLTLPRLRRGPLPLSMREGFRCATSFSGKAFRPGRAPSLHLTARRSQGCRGCSRTTLRVAARGRRRRSLTNPYSPARCSLQEMKGSPRPRSAGDERGKPTEVPALLPRLGEGDRRTPVEGGSAPRHPNPRHPATRAGMTGRRGPCSGPAALRCLQLAYRGAIAPVEMVIFTIRGAASCAKYDPRPT